MSWIERVGEADDDVEGGARGARGSYITRRPGQDVATTALCAAFVDVLCQWCRSRRAVRLCDRCDREHNNCDLSPGRLTSLV